MRTVNLLLAGLFKKKKPVSNKSFDVSNIVFVSTIDVTIFVGQKYYLPTKYGIVGLEGSKIEAKSLFESKGIFVRQTKVKDNLFSIGEIVILLENTSESDFHIKTGSVVATLFFEYESIKNTIKEK